ncbi:MAG: hypothetical protein RLZZ244_365 [Verrucomicrobiota bacterium]
MKHLLPLLLSSVTALAEVSFNRDIRPILSDNCFYCHGNDPSHRKAELRLDRREEALAKKAFIPGTPDSSALIERILTGDPDEVMPPPDSHKRLTQDQKALLKRWIEQGAPYEEHWSFGALRKPAVSGHAVDFLVRQRLTEMGLHASPEADRRILIRRLSLDLLGLPPNPSEVEAFVKDPSPRAYEALVDRLLENPHYGERMAAGWLDVVRFADTIGYHSDVPRNVWPYRDWVIESFNRNKRFDRFTLEQVAGDLLPDATDETRVGSAFNRLLLTTEEGGAQAKDYEQRMLTDRVRAIGAAWLGLTTGCAQCHDHKFDPFTQRDFYALGAFFSDIREPSIGRVEDGLLLPGEKEREILRRLEADVKRATEIWKLSHSERAAAQKDWEDRIRSGVLELSPPRKGVKAEPASSAETQRILELVRKEPARRSAKEREFLEESFGRLGEHPFQTEHTALMGAHKARDAFQNSLPRCLVSVSQSKRRTVRILPRGNWMDETGPVVKAAFPHFLPQPAMEGRELTRLDLAQWLVASDNPLPARTVMNRLWKQFFGTGLSKVLDDLGAQGELPPNQPLLDWLACEFIESGWDLKHMVRTLVTSATYKQVSTTTPTLRSADPDNRHHARQSPFRLDAEGIRDTALAVSGLLQPKIGGPSIKPYQPEGYWENLNFPPREYVADQGPQQYRRGLYVWWQRSFLHPSLLAFDAPSREEACAERTRSNIPQQALVLLNDPTFLEAARGFAARILSECREDTPGRLHWAWQRALQRPPQTEELRRMQTVLAERLEVHRQNPNGAKALLAIGQSPRPHGLDPAELAAWTHVARILLNLHETITRS